MIPCNCKLISVVLSNPWVSHNKVIYSRQKTWFNLEPCRISFQWIWFKRWNNWLFIEPISFRLSFFSDKIEFYNFFSAIFQNFFCLTISYCRVYEDTLNLNKKKHFLMWKVLLTRISCFLGRTSCLYFLY